MMSLAVLFVEISSGLYTNIYIYMIIINVEGHNYQLVQIFFKVQIEYTLN